MCNIVRCSLVVTITKQEMYEQQKSSFQLGWCSGKLRLVCFTEMGNILKQNQTGSLLELY